MSNETRYPYFQMRSMVLDNFNEAVCPDAAFLKIISPELLLAIFWEETQFTNLRQQKCSHQMWLKRWTVPHKKGDAQIPGNHAVGFGQAERDSIATLQSYSPECLDGFEIGVAGKDIDIKDVDTKILANASMAIQISWRVLWGLQKRVKFTTKEALLKGYAGKPNVALVNRWLSTEAIQHAYMQMPPITVQVQSMFPNLILMAGAFAISRHNGAFSTAFYGVTQAEASKVGKKLRTISEGNTGVAKGNPKFITDLHKYATEIALQHAQKTA